MTSPIPLAAIDADAPTSRSIFRLVAKSVGATNRDADTLRQALLARWAEHDGTYELVRRLQSLDSSDPDGALGAEARLAVWLSFAEPVDGRLIAATDPVMAGISDELRDRLAGVQRPPQD
ncbi:MAG: hypothetical protein WA964_19095 [Ilumatobacter sp.]|uniref:hypothetical protein n=1 Tax=Ilumatobacter sp. TaxID=1967498 RepID=UPI003C73279B